MGLRSRFTTMTEDTRKSLYWTGGLTAAILAVIVGLWFAGIFNAGPVQ